MVTVPEEQVLGPKDPRIKNTDDWPIHYLRNVTVVSQETQQAASLLEAHQGCNVRVTGIIKEIAMSSAKQIRDPRWRFKSIEISDVAFYSFAVDEDGSIRLWAPGKAGWFELLEPSASYHKTFSHTKEAVSMFYHLADKQRRPHKYNHYSSVKVLNKYILSVFKDFLLHTRCAPSQRDFDELCSKFHNHARFMITSMLEGQDDQDWQKSAFLRYYKHQFPDLHHEIQSRMKPQLEPQPNEELQSGARQRTQKQEQMQSDAPTEAARMVSRRPTRQNRAQSPKTPEHLPMGNTEPDTSGDEEYDSDGKLIRPGTKRKSKSILQPKGSKFSKKAAGRRQHHPSISNDEAADDLLDDDLAQEESPSLPPVTSQRPVYPYFKPPRTKQILMVSYEIPSDRPQGPGDLWTCTLENCNHRVHQGSTVKGRAQIKEHFQQHARQAQEKIDLALRESRPYLPVNNLVRRIQQAQGNYPAPIIRKY